MKKLLTLLLVLCLMFSLPLPAAAAETRSAEITYRGIKLYLDGRELTPLDEQGSSTEPFIMDSGTYLPLRALAGALALDVRWIPESSTVALSTGGRLSVTSAKPAASHAVKRADISYRGIGVLLDGRPLELKNADGDSVEPFIIDGTTYLPLRVIGEALGLRVEWVSETSSVLLSSPEVHRESLVESLSADREGETILSSSVTDTWSYPRFTLVTERSAAGTLRARSITYYDAEGRATEALYYDGKDTLTAAETWTYGEDGLLKRFVRDESEGSEGDSCTLYEYKDGRLSRSKRFDGDTVPRVHSTNSTYTYDENGLLTKLYIHLPMGSWEEIIYEYVAEGQLLSESRTFYDILGSGYSRSSVSYIYDGGLLVRSVDNAGCATEYFYDSDGLLAKTVAERLNGSFVIKSYSRP